MLIDIRVVGQTIGVATALYALYAFARRPRREQLEVAAALITFASATFFAFDLSAGQLLIVALGASAGPYLLVRLSDHFRPVPTWLDRVMLAGAVYVVGFGLWYTTTGGPAGGTLQTTPAPPLPLVALQLAYQVGGFTYGAAVFVLEARRAAGARRWRLRAAALGTVLVALSTGLLAAAIVASVSETGLIRLAPWVEAAYYLVYPLIGMLFLAAFAPPPWLRQMWRLGELRHFLADTAQMSVGERGREALDALATSAVRATGAARATITLADAVEHLGPVTDLSTEVRAAWSSGAPAMSPRGIAIPVRTSERRFGVLGLSFARPPLFPRDDAEIVELMAEHTAIALANDELFRTQRVLEERERRRTEAELARVEDELRVAREIQQALLPRELPDLPGWRIASYYQPAREVGGDFYDVFPLAGGRFAVVVGDASGKGIPAALLMATTRSVLRAASLTSAGPGTTLATVNEVLCRAMPANMFVTCMVVVIDPATGTLRYANAGHDVGYLRCDGAVEDVRARGMPLGLIPGSVYDEAEGHASVGATLVLYSDGIVEAHDSARQLFSFGRLRAIVGRADGDLIADVLAELRAFTPPDWEQEDDITMVTAQRLA